ncbi:MAG: hypothetical protein C5B50_23035 [Verrucomicrobia bacterium]|nr:MAG: hypothetical protein C5B50_23035 [Verrucomicrobiota bacterium]
MTTTATQALRILVVDDEPSVREVLKSLLEVDGYSVWTAASGTEALAMLESVQFDLILTDYCMPGMKGDQLAAAIKALRPEQPIGMITAYPAMYESSNTGLDCVDFLITKPVMLENLRAAIRNAHAQPPRRASDN